MMIDGIAQEGDSTGDALEDLYWNVMRLRPAFPGAPILRIRPDWREATPPSGPAAAIWADQLRGVRTVLDVGAGDAYWGKVLQRLGVDAEYRTADTETRHRHDYRDFLAVDDRFDAILMLELLEHLPLDLGLRFIRHASKILAPRGVLAIGTPNPRHAYQVWNADFTHIRPWPVHDIWAVCKIIGFGQVDAYRQQLVGPRRRLAVSLQAALCKLLDLDPAYGLLVFARKTG